MSSANGNTPMHTDYALVFRMYSLDRDDFRFTDAYLNTVKQNKQLLRATSYSPINSAGKISPF